MSRIGNKPVELPGGVKLEIKGRVLSISGPKGTQTWEHPAEVEVAVEDSRVIVKRQNNEKRSRECHGLTRALIANMVKGVTDGYEKRLLIFGTGYGCNLRGKTLDLNLGFMGRSVNKGPQYSVEVPDGLEVVVETPNARGESDPAKLLIKGIDKQQVGQFAAEIRSLRKPEPYKGKGVRYEDEFVRRKQGKALTTGG